MVKRIVATAVGNTAKKVRPKRSIPKSIFLGTPSKISAVGIYIAPPINNPVAAKESALIVGHRRVMILPIA